MNETNMPEAAPKTVSKFVGRRIQVSPVAQPSGAPAPVVIPAKQPLQKMVQKFSAQVKPPNEANGLRTDGPTIEEYVEAGYDAASYPPTGYAVRAVTFRFAKLRGVAAVTTFADKTTHKWFPKRTHGGGYAPTTSFETTDAVLAAKLREAAKLDSSIREAPPR